MKDSLKSMFLFAGFYFMLYAFVSTYAEDYVDTVIIAFPFSLLVLGVKAFFCGLPKLNKFREQKPKQTFLFSVLGGYFIAFLSLLFVRGLAVKYGSLYFKESFIEIYDLAQAIIILIAFSVLAGAFCSKVYRLFKEE
ncbi:MAG: hypothetical protein ACK5N8_04275 [Alphaproteobacteria bacterium]